MHDACLERSIEIRHDHVVFAHLIKNEHTKKLLDQRIRWHRVRYLRRDECLSHKIPAYHSRGKDDDKDAHGFAIFEDVLRNSFSSNCFRPHPDLSTLSWPFSYLRQNHNSIINITKNLLGVAASPTSNHTGTAKRPRTTNFRAMFTYITHAYET